MLDSASGWCVGCGRSGNEVAAWGSLDPEGRARVWQSLPERMTALGTGYRLLPWTPQVLAGHLEALAARTAGRWWTATAALEGPAAVRRDRLRLALETPQGRLRLNVAPGIRTFLVPTTTAPHLAFCLHGSRLAGAGRGPLVVAPAVARLDAPAVPATAELTGLPDGYLAVLAFTPAPGTALPPALLAA